MDFLPQETALSPGVLAGVTESEAEAIERLPATCRACSGEADSSGEDSASLNTPREDLSANRIGKGSELSRARDLDSN